MSGGYISFYNASTAFSDAELANALPDFQSQVSNEFNWYWGLNAYLDINGGVLRSSSSTNPGRTIHRARWGTISLTETTSRTPSSSRSCVNNWDTQSLV